MKSNSDHKISTNSSGGINDDTTSQPQTSLPSRLPPDSPQKQPATAPRKLSLQQELQGQSSVYGQFQYEGYKVMRGYVPTKGVQIRLYYTKLEPKNKVASVCLVHDYGESTQNYLEFADHLAKNRFSVHIVDLRGFGYSGGDRIQAHCTHLLDDIEVLLRCSEPHLPLFLVSHGFGCLLSFALLCQNPTIPLHGFICMSPIFEFGEKHEPSILGEVMRGLCLYLFSNTLVNNHLNPSGFTKDSRQLKKKLEDGLAYQYTTLSMLDELEHLAHYVQKNAYKITCPTAIFVGAKSAAHNNEKVQAIFQKISGADKTMRSFSEGYHTMHLDDQSSQVEKEIVAWIKERIVTVRRTRNLPPLNKYQFRRASRARGILYVILGLLVVLKAVRFFRRKFS